MYAKVALIQTDIRPESVDCNLRTIELLIATAPQSDLYVLPETFATGFAAEPNEAAKAEQKIIEMMTRVVTKSDCAICGSLIVERDGRYRNRLLFVTPKGVESYDKRHLFSIGGEGEQYTTGIERVVVEWRGIRWLLSTCYDLRFPVWLRNRGDYDAMICVASWPAAKAEVWDTLLRARAIENVAYTIGVNRVGDDHSTHYEGGSVVYDFRGRAIAQCGNKACTVTAAIDREALEEFRGKFPVERDADDFELLTEKRSNR